MNSPDHHAGARIRYRVAGMDCAGCAAKIHTAVSRIPGVADVSVSLPTASLTARHDASAGAEVERVVSGLGYGISPIQPAGTHDHAHGDHGHHHAHTVEGEWWQGAGLRLAAASGLAILAAYGLAALLPEYAPWFHIAAVAVGLAPVARRAFAAARAGTPFSIEMLMTIAAFGAVVIGASAEAAVVVFLFLLGELLEGVAASRARDGIAGLAALVPDKALLERDGTLSETAAARLLPDDVILVRPGDRIPGDGIIISGESGIDEAPVTGESVPRHKLPGAEVFAGTVNLTGVLRIRVTASAQDNTIARVIRLVEQAQEAKAPTQRIIDRFARAYTPGIVAAAALVAVVPPLALGAEWHDWIYKGLAILLIGCPCALVISTPAAIAAALSAGARRGLLMKGGAVLEQLGRITVAAFDKTGTLTEGRPQVTDVVGIGRTDADVLRLAGALEAGSNHPIAVAILRRAEEDGIALPAVTGAVALAGQGVAGRARGQALFLGSAEAAAGRVALDGELPARIAALQQAGKTVSVLVADGAPAGIIALRDEPRADAPAGIAALRALGVRPVMLTGDNAAAASAIGAALGIIVHAGLLPEDKQKLVRQMQQSGEVVAKIGDGINDAPALAAADVGIAMGGGADVALEVADAAILHGRVADVAEMVALSRSCIANIRQNIAVALGLKAVFLVTTLIGVTGLWPAILADTGATVLVTMNALRLLRANQPAETGPSVRRTASCQTA
jgi:Zn2+/Cd2+-exporting ATPase